MPYTVPRTKAPWAFDLRARCPPVLVPHLPTVVRTTTPHTHTTPPTPHSSKAKGEWAEALRAQLALIPTPRRAHWWSEPSAIIDPKRGFVRQINGNQRSFHSVVSLEFHAGAGDLAPPPNKPPHCIINLNTLSQGPGIIIWAKFSRSKSTENSQQAPKSLFGICVCFFL